MSVGCWVVQHLSRRFRDLGEIASFVPPSHRWQSLLPNVKQKWKSSVFLSNGQHFDQQFLTLRAAQSYWCYHTRPEQHDIQPLGFEFDRNVQPHKVVAWMCKASRLRHNLCCYERQEPLDPGWAQQVGKRW